MEIKTETKKTSILKMVINGMKEVYSKVWKDLKDLPNAIRFYKTKTALKLQLLETDVKMLLAEESNGLCEQSVEDIIRDYNYNNEIADECFVADKVERELDCYEFATQSEVYDEIVKLERKLTRLIDEKAEEAEEAAEAATPDLSDATKDVVERFNRQAAIINLMFAMRDNAETIDKNLIKDWFFNSLNDSI